MLYDTLSREVAKVYGLDPLLVVAVVTKESSGNPWAWNPEPHYRYLVNVRTRIPFRAQTAAERASEVPPADFPTLAGDRDQEWWGQQASWGLMQVMGAVAREHGMQQPYLTALCDPTVGLEYGCKHLRAQLVRSKGDVRKALCAYNSGGLDTPAGNRYADAVLAIRATLT